MWSKPVFLVTAENISRYAAAIAATHTPMFCSNETEGK